MFCGDSVGQVVTIGIAVKVGKIVIVWRSGEVDGMDNVTRDCDRMNGEVVNGGIIGMLDVNVERKVMGGVIIGIFEFNVKRIRSAAEVVFGKMLLLLLTQEMTTEVFLKESLAKWNEKWQKIRQSSRNCSQ